MGMGNITSHLIIFIAVISISAVVVGVFNNQMDSTTSSIVRQQNELSNQLRTDFEIEVIRYQDLTENQTTVYLENTGSTILELDTIDVYLNGERVPRDENARSIAVLNDTEIRNEGLWDPKEKLMIVINKTLDTSSTYQVTVTSQHSGNDKEVFST